MENRPTTLILSLARAAFLLHFGLFVFALSAHCAIPQGKSGAVSVRVSEADNDEPIFQADVRLYTFGHGSFSYQAYSDGGGRTTFSTVERGQYYLEVRKAGYEVFRESIEVSPGGVVDEIVQLRRFVGPSTPGTGGRAVSAASLSIPAAALQEFEAGNSSIARDPSGSIAHFRKAVEIYPKYAEAHVMMALAYLKLSQREDAKKAIGKSIEGDPNFSKAYTLRGRLLLEDRELGMAEAALKESLRLDPQAWDAHFELARCYYNMGKMKEALEQARQARDMPESNPVTHLLLADIYLKLDQKKEAIHELEAFAKAEPASPMLPRVQQKIATLRAQP